MKTLRPLLGPLTLLLTMLGCTSASQNGLSGEATLAPYNVRWVSMGEPRGTPADNLTPLLFTFSWSQEPAGAAIPEAAWEREAQRLGSSVYIVKNHIYGSSAYLTRDGEFRMCTVSAVRRGLCGKRLNLSVAKRVAMARNVLGLQSRCRWTGFDPAYHKRVAYGAGGEPNVLFVRADCS